MPDGRTEKVEVSVSGYSGSSYIEIDPAALKSDANGKYCEYELTYESYSLSLQCKEQRRRVLKRKALGPFFAMQRTMIQDSSAPQLKSCLCIP